MKIIASHLQAIEALDEASQLISNARAFYEMKRDSRLSHEDMQRSRAALAAASVNLQEALPTLREDLIDRVFKGST